jgi:hypothetical protein
LDVGTSSGTVCAGDDSRLADSRKCNNTFDNAATARSALELGNAAILTAGTAANNLVQLNASGQMPAVHGANLTGFSALAKLALTTHKIIYIDGNSAPQLLALGAAGTVLKSQGAAAAPVFGAVSTGDAWEYVSKGTAANSANIAFTGLDFTTYDYRFEFKHLTLNANAALVGRFGTGATPTYLTTGYGGVIGAFLGSTDGIQNSLWSTYAYLITGNVVGITGGGYIETHQPSGGRPELYGQAAMANGDGNRANGCVTGGCNFTTTAVTAIQFALNTGNIPSGDIIMYRKPKR